MKKAILKKIINLFGKETQINKLQEELLELALVLNQRKCPTKNKDVMEDKLYDELADVKIVMAQAELLFDSKRINDTVDKKLQQFVVKYLNK